MTALAFFVGLFLGLPLGAVALFGLVCMAAASCDRDPETGEVG